MTITTSTITTDAGWVAAVALGITQLPADYVPPAIIHAALIIHMVSLIILGICARGIVVPPDGLLAKLSVVSPPPTPTPAPVTYLPTHAVPIPGESKFIDASDPLIDKGGV